MYKRQLKNIPQSAFDYGKNLVHPFTHPLETLKNFWTLQRGLADVLGLPNMLPVSDEEKETTRAVGKFFVDRYGGLENLKQTVAKDPVGVLSDASLVLTAGGSLVGQAPGLVGRIGKTTADIGKTINPVNLAINAGKFGVKAATEIIGSPAGAGTSGAPIREAYAAGAQGGDRSRSFTDSMRGNISPQVVVDEAKDALANMRIERSNQYKMGMAGVKADTNVLDFNEVEKAVDRVAQIGTFKGKILNKPAAEVWTQIKEVVDDWSKSNPADFHTAEGLDALKQAVGNIRQSTQFGTPGRVVADGVYNAVKAQIVKQAPHYAEVMKGYEEASDLITDIEKTLSLGDKASVDTSLRKLQSVMRNNVNTTYGRRVELVDKLAEAGAPNLPAKIAGQSMNAFVPRGLGGLSTAGAVGAGLFSGHPEVLAALPFQSPRIMGEVAHGMGIASRYAPETELLRLLGQMGYQTNRINQGQFNQ